jgi:hypothetical protein
MLNRKKVYRNYMMVLSNMLVCAVNNEQWGIFNSLSLVKGGVSPKHLKISGVSTT